MGIKLKWYQVVLRETKVKKRKRGVLGTLLLQGVVGGLASRV